MACGSSEPGRSINGTVWASQKTLLAANFDRRMSGDERATTLTIRLPHGGQEKQSWRVIRLSGKVQPIDKHGWQLQASRSQLVLSGPLRPGELILIEQGGP